MQFVAASRPRWKARPMLVLSRCSHCQHGQWVVSPFLSFQPSQGQPLKLYLNNKEDHLSQLELFLTPRAVQAVHRHSISECNSSHTYEHINTAEIKYLPITSNLVRNSKFERVVDILSISHMGETLEQRLRCPNWTRQLQGIRTNATWFQFWKHR